MAYVQFTDETEKKIGAVYSADPGDTVKNSGEVDEDDERLVEFWKNFPIDR